METSTIEQLDKSRYKLLKWTTIGWSIWFGAYILKGFIKEPVIINLALAFGLFGWIIFSISLIQFFKLKRELRWNKQMQHALEDELHLFNLHKSYQIGYSVVICMTVLFFGLSLYSSISATIVTELILYFGVLSVLISGLIYNRES